MDHLQAHYYALTQVSTQHEEDQKADIETESKWVFVNVCFGEIKRTFDVRISLNRYNTVFDFDLLAQYSMDIGSQKRRKL